MFLFFYSPLAAPSGHRNFHKKRSSNNFLFPNKSLSWARKDFARSWPPTTDDDRNIFALKCFGSLSQGYAIYAWKHPAFMAPQLWSRPHQRDCCGGEFLGFFSTCHALLYRQCHCSHPTGQIFHAWILSPRYFSNYLEVCGNFSGKVKFIQKHISCGLNVNFRNCLPPEEEHWILWGFSLRVSGLAVPNY